MPKSAPKSSNININLLPKEGPEGTVNTGLHWLLTVGRFLIIFAEVAALVILFWAIILQTQKNNLEKSIRDKQTTIENERGFVTEFVQTQNRLNQIRQLKEAQFPTNLVLSEMLKLLPTEVKLTELKVDKDAANFNGTFQTTSGLQTLIDSFNASNKLVDLDISTLTTPSTQNPNFTFSAKVTIVPQAFEKDLEIQ